LARDDAQVVAVGAELFDGVDDAVVRADEAVVIRNLVLAIRRDQGLALRVVPGVTTEHRAERNANARGPLRIRRRGAGELVAGGSGGSEDELDGVDQRAIQIEEDGGFSRGHTLR